jgi:hypothetical protein
MRSADGFSIRINNLQLMSNNLEPKLETMPFMRPIQEEIATLVVEGRQLEADQENARKQFTEFVRRRQELEKRGEDLRLRAAAMLRGAFGFTSEELIPFGIRPRPRNTAPRKRKTKAEKEAEAAKKQTEAKAA